MSIKPLVLSIVLAAFFGKFAQAQCPFIAGTAVQDNLCAGDELGAIILSVTDGIPPYTYVWNESSVPFDTIIDNGAIFNLPEGDYSVVISDNAGCSTTSAILTVSTPDPLLAPSIVVNQPLCNFSDGSITVNLTGGTLPYQYFWSTGDNIQTVNNLPPGTYTVTVTDNNDCETYVEDIILESDSDLSVSVNDLFQNCAFDIGTLVANVTGGTPPYNYQWTPQVGLSDPTVFNPNVLSDSPFTEYTLWVTDDNGCIAIDQAMVTVSNLPLNIDVDDVNCFGGNDGWINLQTGGLPVTASINGGPPSTQTFWFGLFAGSYQIDYSYNGCDYTELVTVVEPTSLLEASGTVLNTSCNGAPNGEIDLTILGGTPPYELTWNNGSTDEDLTGLASGLYVVTITDTDTCSIIQEFTVSQANALTVTPNLVFETCQASADGGIGVQANNGLPPFFFEWSTGVTEQGLTSTLNDLPAGSYDLTVSDSDGCSNTFSYDLPAGPYVPKIVLSPPAPNPIMYDCDDTDQSAMVSVLVSGGIPSQDFSDYIFDLTGTGTSSDVIGFNIPIDAPIEFEVADGASWTLTVYDDQGCDQVVLADTYDYATSCIACVGIPSTFVDAGPDQVICSDSITLGGSPTTNGNISIVSIEWSPTIGITNPNFDSPNAIVSENTIYQVVVTDDNGCVQTDEVFVQVAPTPMIIEDAVITPSTCQPDGIIDLVNGGVTGGLPPYTWLWTGPNGYSSTQPIAAFGLAGNFQYCVDVTDAIGCTVQECFFVPSNNNFAITGFETTPDCGDGGGTAAPIISNGGNSDFLWTDGQTDSIAVGLEDGFHCVTVSNISGCVEVACVEILPEDCVWPGDANYDGFANNEDILALGLTYGFTGPVRQNASNDYTGQPADDWNTAFASGLNHKHADCDGDGIVGFLDTIPISLNYGLEHPFNFGTPDYNVDDPPLFLVASADTVAPGELVIVDLEYGDMDNPITDFYGIALGIELEEDFVVPTSFIADFSDSWVAAPDQQITLAKYLPGIFEIGISRIDQQNASGFGKIARFTFVIEDNIDGFQASGPVPLILEIVNVTIISNDESLLPFNPISEEVIIDPESTSLLNPTIAEQINLFPNPAHDRIVVEHPGIEVQSFRIIDVMGRTVDQ
ncbi:MAG: SprB repeat-containing protein, partial [Bacteroidota bacterium]